MSQALKSRDGKQLYTQSTTKLETQISQLADAITKGEQEIMSRQSVENPEGQLRPAQIQPSSQFYKQAKSMTTLRNGCVLEYPHDE